MKIPLPLKFDPFPPCRCQSRLPACAPASRCNIQSNLHLSSCTILGGFIPSCFLFHLKPLCFAVSNKYYFYLITCLWQPPAFLPLWAPLHVWCRLSSTAGKCALLMIDDSFSPADSLLYSGLTCPTCKGYNMNTCSTNKPHLVPFYPAGCCWTRS